MTIYLYVKTHNETGLKYLGKTVQDPFRYKGSGKRWTNHIRKHGYDVTTEILFETDSKEELKQVGLYYSELYNIVDSNEWANIIPEACDGFDSDTSRKLAIERVKLGTHHFLDRSPKSKEARQKMSAAKKGKGLGKDNSNYGNKWSKEQKESLSKKRKENGLSAGKNNPMYGQKRPDLTERNKLPKAWVTNNVEDKLILESELDKYLKLGYQKGRCRSGNKGKKISTYKTTECGICGKHIRNVNYKRHYNKCSNAK